MSAKKEPNLPEPKPTPNLIPSHLMTDGIPLKKDGTPEEQESESVALTLPPYSWGPPLYNTVLSPDDEVEGG